MKVAMIQAPELPEVDLREAEAAFRAGQEQRGLQLLGALTVRQPMNPALWHRIAALALRIGRAPDAIAAGSMAVRLKPDCVDYRLALADALQGWGDLARAIAEYEIAAVIAPDDPRVGARLAGLREVLTPGANNSPSELPAGARQLLEQGARLQAAGQPAQALAAFVRVAQLVPGLALVHYRIACLLHDLGQAEDALSHYELAARLQADLFGAAHNAGKVAAGFGLVERARRYLSQAHQLRPQDGVSMRLDLLTEAIHDSTESVAQSRARFEQGLDRILSDPPRIDDPLNKADLPMFFFAYHGLCNRELHTKLARAFTAVTPDLTWQAPHCARDQRRSGRVRIGFISRFLRTHSIGKVAKGLIAGLDRTRFEVYVLNIPPVVMDDTARWIKDHCDHWLTVADTLVAARTQIAALELDVLFYQDIGMEPFSYLLAFARLAKVQCVSYGHPDTTGIANMDYFISNDLYEPPGATAHYSERLVALHDLPTLAYYFRPQVPQPLPTRSELGLPADAHLYFCAQTLFKLHPDFDGLVKRILERDGAGRVVLFSGECAYWSVLLQKRFRRAMPDVADRIQFLPRQQYPRFLQILSVADVVLDTPHFNGMNTSIDAFSVGTPVVTLPGALQRGRFTQAMYRTMEIHDGVATTAEDYANLAVGIATTPDRRRALGKLIRERNHLLFEDRRAIKQFEDFFLEAHAQATRS